MSNNGHQDILKYFKFVVFFVGRILGKQKNLFNINKLQEIFYPLGDANKRSSVERAFESKFCAFFLFDRLPFSKAFSAAAEQSGRGVLSPSRCVRGLTDTPPPNIFSADRRCL